jgi:hypothetical protein
LHFMYFKCKSIRKISWIYTDKTLWFNRIWIVVFKTKRWRKISCNY